MDGTVLLADDDRTIRTVLTQALTRAGCKVHATSSLVTLMRWVEEGKGDLVISDVVMPDGNGLDMLPKIGERRPNLPVIVISAQNTIMTAIEAEERAAFDYLPKPFDLPDLMKRTARALDVNRKAQARPPSAPREAAPPADLPLVGRSAPMQGLYRLVARMLNTDLAVLIVGESGSGKSLLARAVHDLSDRRTLPFVTARAADLGGVDGPSALLARVKGGTLLFDEVGDFPPEAQAKIVRMLDAFADTAPRVMATSQTDLAGKMEDESFRQDLYYRLNGVTLAVPPLRERVEDIPLLAEHFLSRAESDRAPRRLKPEAAELLRAYSWPGNVRQLENTIRRLALGGPEAEIGRGEVEAALGREPAAEPIRTGGEGEKLSASIGKHLRRYFDLHGGALPPPGLYDRILREMEAPLIEIALDATGGNQAKCADLLGINRNTLRKKITDLDLRVTRRRKLM
jgi:two-component system nitrogen regulation response regulator GlnG